MINDTNIEYVARGSYSFDDRIKGFIEDKLGKVGRFLVEPAEIRVILETEKHRHIAELQIHHRLGNFQAKEEAGDMYDAVNTAIDKAERQARKSRKKLTGRKRRAESIHHQWPVEIVERASLGHGDTPRVIRSTQLRIKPMSIDEAALELQDSKNDFVVFRNAASDKVNVLYKRRDENYGLIAPEL